MYFGLYDRNQIKDIIYNIYNTQPTYIIYESIIWVYINCNLVLKDKYFLKRNYSFEVYLFFKFLFIHKCSKVWCTDTLRWKCNRKCGNIISEIHQNLINHNNNNCIKWWYLYKIMYKKGMNERVPLTIIMLNWDLFYVIYFPFFVWCVNGTELNLYGFFYHPTVIAWRLWLQRLKNSVFSHTNKYYFPIPTYLEVVPPVQIIFTL